MQQEISYIRLKKNRLPIKSLKISPPRPPISAKICQNENFFL